MSEIIANLSGCNVLGLEIILPQTFEDISPLPPSFLCCYWEVRYYLIPDSLEAVLVCLSVLLEKHLGSFLFSDVPKFH